MAQWQRICLPMQETQETSVLSRGGKIPQRRKWQVTPNILAWKILWTEEPGGLQSIESQRVGHDCVTNTFTFHFCFTTFHLCGNSILQSQRAWALSLTTGLLVRIQTRPRSLVGNQSHCRPQASQDQICILNTEILLRELTSLMKEDNLFF